MKCGGRTGFYTLVQVGPFVARGREIIGAWEKLPMPVIAALDGVRLIQRKESGFMTIQMSRLRKSVQFIFPGGSWRRFGNGPGM